MKSRRIARRASSYGLTVLICAVAFGAVLSSEASAATTLTMGAPEAGGRTGATPTFSGTTTDSLDEVKVLIYKGEGTSSTPVEELETFPLVGSWSAQEVSPLAAGTYTAQAEQSELEILGGGTAKSEPPVTFEVVTAPPTVTIVGPGRRPATRRRRSRATASEDTEVEVHVLEGATQNDPDDERARNERAYGRDADGQRDDDRLARAKSQVLVYKGKGTSGTPVEPEGAFPLVGSWSVQEVSPLVAGTYTAQAQQTEPEILDGDTAKSEPVTFEVDTRTARRHDRWAAVLRPATAPPRSRAKRAKTRKWSCT